MKKNNGVKIGKHEEYEIWYSNNEFIGYKGKKATEGYATETSLRSHIDNLKQDDEAQKLRLKAEKQRKNYDKLLSSSGFELEFEPFLEYVQSCYIYQNEITFHYDYKKKVLHNTTLDPANVLMFHREIRVLEGSLKVDHFSVNVSTLLDVLKELKRSGLKKNRLYLKFEKADTDHFLLIQSRIGTHKILILKDLEDYRPHKIPALEFKASAILECKNFYSYLSNCEVSGSSSAWFCSKKGRLKFSSEYDSTSYDSINIVGKGTSKSRYSTEYLLKKEKGARFFRRGNLHIQFKDDYPLKIEDEKGNWFILAPRVENE